MILGVLFIAGGLLSFNLLSDLLCKSDALRPMTEGFMLVTILSAVPQLLMYTLHQYVTVDGSPKLISRAVIVGNIFNIVCDIIFIKYCGWGISGAAWATFIMYVVCILMVLPHFRKKGSLRLCMPKGGDIDYGQICSYGFPLFISTVLLSVQYVGNNYVASTYLGDGGLIAIAVCMQLFAFSMIILTGTLRTIALVLSFGQTLLPMVGFWLLQGGWIGFFLGQAVVAVVILICTTFVRSKDKSLTPLFLIPKGEDKDVYDVTIETTITSLGENSNDIFAFLQSQGLTTEDANRYVLCAEELIKNIIDHGHAKYVDIRATKNVISIHDDGKPFNPLEYSISPALTDREGDHLGLKIVNGIGIDMKYDYRFNQNMLNINIK